MLVAPHFHIPELEGLVQNVDGQFKIQSIFYNHFKWRIFPYNPAPEIERKLARWRFRLHPSPFLAANRTASVLNGLLPPRFFNTLILTWFNGWCTDRRYQNYSKCPFCECWLSECSLEHLSQCRFLKALLKNCFYLPPYSH